MRPLGLNPWAILVATLLGFLIGGLWYGPFFGQAWLQALGKSQDQLLPPGLPMLVALISQAGFSVALALLIVQLDLRSLWKGLQLGLLVGIGFNAMAMAADFTFANWGFRLFLIEAGFRVAYTALSGALLAAWR